MDKLASGTKVQLKWCSCGEDVVEEVTEHWLGIYPSRKMSGAQWQSCLSPTDSEASSILSLINSSTILEGQLVLTASLRDPSERFEESQRVLRRVYLTRARDAEGGLVQKGPLSPLPLHQRIVSDHRSLVRNCSWQSRLNLAYPSVTELNCIPFWAITNRRSQVGQERLRRTCNA